MRVGCISAKKNINIASSDFFQHAVICYFYEIVYSRRRDKYNFNRITWAIECTTRIQYNNINNDLQNKIERTLNNLINKEINSESIININSLLLNSKDNKSNIRTVDAWSENSRGQIDYKFQNHIEIEQKIIHFSEIINKCSKIEDVIEFYSDFLDVHPFNDGNGRTAKLFVEYMLKKLGFSVIHPHLFFINGLHGKSKSGLIVTRDNARKSIDWACERTILVQQELKKLLYFPAQSRSIQNELFLNTEIIKNLLGVDDREALYRLNELSKSKEYECIPAYRDLILFRKEILNTLTNIDKMILVGIG